MKRLLTISVAVILVGCAYPYALWAFVPSLPVTFTVDSIGDDADNNPGNGVCLTDPGQCTLRAAIQEANASVASGPDTIAFSIAGGGVHTISPASSLPEITDSVIIDGTTQPGFSVGNPMIELDGSALFIGPVLYMTAGGSTVKGLVINRDNNSSEGQIQLRTNGGNTIQGNFLGTDAMGTSASAGPSATGIVIINSSGNLIGGTAAAARNVIAGLSGKGIIINGTSTNNQIQGNFIGTDKTGAVVLPVDEGVVIGGTSNVLGGTTVGAGNVIAGGLTRGMRAGDVGGHQIKGNFIGTDVSGTLDLGNAGEGIWLVSGDDILIGGMAAGASNIIAFNGGPGVSVGAGTGHRVLSNSIFSNGGLGIDLLGDGVTDNDTGDGDTGVNNLQNFPVLTSSVSAGGSTNIQGSFNSVPNTTGYRIEFFSNDGCDSLGNGEGKAFLGTTTVDTDGYGNASFSADLGLSVSTGKQITATATDSADNTSEFSACIASYSPGCGNGTVDAGEECDDGNVSPDDGCDAVCLKEEAEGGTTGGTTGDPASGMTGGATEGGTVGGEESTSEEGGCSLIRRPGRRPMQGFASLSPLPTERSAGSGIDGAVVIRLPGSGDHAPVFRSGE